VKKLLLLFVMVGMAGTAAARENDFPTAARAEYVFACMAVNSTSQEFLNKCSCSIDVIASRISYDQYVQAETILRMQLVLGGDAEMFFSADIAEPLKDFRRAQAAAEIHCF
jgi:hypothetical protein